MIVPDADASAFKTGLAVTYYDLSATALHSETMTVLTVGGLGSGGGPGKTLITLSGIWGIPPVANDLLVVAYGNYSMSSIFNEYLGISPTGFLIFTSPDSLAKWYGFTDLIPMKMHLLY